MAKPPKPAKAAANLRDPGGKDAALLNAQVIDSPGATPAQKIQAFEAMGRPLEYVSTILQLAQLTADFDLADQLINQLRPAYAQGKGAQANESPLSNLLWCEDEAINIQVVKNWSAKALPSVNTEPLPSLEPLQGRRIRVGYVLSDFREQAASHSINGLLRNHDHSKFEIFMYCSGWSDGSPVRKEVESHCDHVHSIDKLSDHEAAALIRSHRIDVLVELNGPTRANRMGILAYRSAPVQIDYLGWPGSVGGRVVDYVVGDDITLPKALEHTYPEKIIRLSKVYQINDYAARTLPPKPTRREVGLPEGDFLVLGMFNAIEKVNKQVWAVWMKIMQAVPNTVLWILDPGPIARKNIELAAQRYGVDIKRIIGAPRLPEELHIARLQHCDLMLDPWPCGGQTSTADALFAGVPVVALMGRNFAGRVSAALLHAVGLKGLVANDLQGYANLLVYLLKKPSELERVKAFVKEKVPASDVFNARDKARQMEEAYEGAVRQLGKEAAVTLPLEIAKEFNVQAYYINLDSSVDRRKSLEEQLARFGLKNIVSRFPAIRKTEGRGRLPASALGCLESHLSLIRQANEKQHLVVFEDDAVLTPQCVEALKSLDTIFETKNVDILFFGQTVLYRDIPTHKVLLKLIREWENGNREKTQFLDAQLLYRFGAFGYAINRGSVKKLSVLTAKHEESTAPLAIDVIYASLIQKKSISGLIFFPYVVGVNPEQPTTLEGRNLAREHISHSELVNLYLIGSKFEEEVTNWMDIVKQEPDELALAVARQVYRNLI
jgi:predicted O-linked N-acetylglucosamine transferase (SPINDLY family)/GR25 family glycosyltransferase involved in LPS biosynthesis